MIFIYDLLVAFYLIFTSPFYLFKILKGQKYRSGLKERFGSLDSDKWSKIGGKEVCWVHAVSVGEVLSSETFIRRLKIEFPDFAIVLSTVTETGQQRAQNLGVADVVFYLPLDLKRVVRKVMNQIRPKALIVVETELWPRLLLEAKQRGASTWILNGRISDRSFPKYRMTRWFWKRLLLSVDGFAMQTKVDADRILEMGAPHAKVHVSGNIKFDKPPAFLSEEDKNQLIKELFGVGSQKNVWVAGSTHPGEEEWILEVYIKLKKDFSNLKLVIAPRHPERFEEVDELIQKQKFTVTRRSSGNSNDDPMSVFLLDSMGELSKIYGIADVVFIGNSLAGQQGGHNPLEPAAFGKPILFGNRMDNFKEVSKLLLETQGAVEVKDQEELYAVLYDWLSHPEIAESIGQNSYRAYKSKQGATEQCLNLIKPFLEK